MGEVAPGSATPPKPFNMASSNGEDLAGLQGLSLESSPVKPSSSVHTTRASSSEPSSSSGATLPMFVQQEDLEDLDDEDDDEGGGRKGKKSAINPGRRKIEIEYIDDKVWHSSGSGQFQSCCTAKCRVEQAPYHFQQA